MENSQKVLACNTECLVYETEREKKLGQLAAKYFMIWPCIQVGTNRVVLLGFGVEASIDIDGKTYSGLPNAYKPKSRSACCLRAFSKRLYNRCQELRAPADPLIQMVINRFEWMEAFVRNDGTLEEGVEWNMFCLSRSKIDSVLQRGALFDALVAGYKNKKTLGVGSIVNVEVESDITGESATTTAIIVAVGVNEELTRQIGGKVWSWGNFVLQWYNPKTYWLMARAHFCEVPEPHDLEPTGVVAYGTIQSVKFGDATLQDKVTLQKVQSIVPWLMQHIFSAGLSNIDQIGVIRHVTKAAGKSGLKVFSSGANARRTRKRSRREI